MDHREEKSVSLITKLAAQFLNQHSNGSSLITVTRAEFSKDLKNATIFVTVLPEEKSAEALNFAKRQRPELREYVKENARFGILPFIDIELDCFKQSSSEIEENGKKG